MSERVIDQELKPDFVKLTDENTRDVNSARKLVDVESVLRRNPRLAAALVELAATRFLRYCARAKVA